MQAIDDAIRGIVEAMWGDDKDAYEEDTIGQRDLAVVLWALGYPPEPAISDDRSCPGCGAMPGDPNPGCWHSVEFDAGIGRGR